MFFPEFLSLEERGQGEGGESRARVFNEDRWRRLHPPLKGGEEELKIEESAWERILFRKFLTHIKSMVR
jgi:hypothetical protein